MGVVSGWDGKINTGIKKCCLLLKTEIPFVTYPSSNLYLSLVYCSQKDNEMNSRVKYGAKYFNSK